MLGEGISPWLRQGRYFIVQGARNDSFQWPRFLFPRPGFRAPRGIAGMSFGLGSAFRQLPILLALPPPRRCAIFLTVPTPLIGAAAAFRPSLGVWVHAVVLRPPFEFLVDAVGGLR